MPISNSDIAAKVDFIHARNDTFIRQFLIEDNENPKNPINLEGYTFSLEIEKTLKTPELVVTADSSNYISITGEFNHIIFVEIPKEFFKFDPGKYVLKLRATSPGGITQTWIDGAFILN